MENLARSRDDTTIKQQYLNSCFNLFRVFIRGRISFFYRTFFYPLELVSITRILPLIFSHKGAPSRESNHFRQAFTPVASSLFGFYQIFCFTFLCVWGWRCVCACMRGYRISNLVSRERFQRNGILLRHNLNTEQT